ncbi:class I SAM-dependent methyltransferase [Chitinophaga sp. Ak27]|uniref:class I SAM-dependent methyltransferase n=1 Tax=Chitinophaga sp. Ak27 TaxID=2726116 RepID=UPI001834D2A3|nr:methyltransferase domain-containing protein [Chitinophaga sp. Ak27]NLU93273.1 class I SAM-dependent methyltransferase [Chitinophaga sp. Ak27]
MDLIITDLSIFPNMYLVKGLIANNENGFDWDSYFLNKSEKKKDISPALESIFTAARSHLKENHALLGFVFQKFMRQLLKDVRFPSPPRILELGAATGFLTKWLVDNSGGTGTLVDRSDQAYAAFMDTMDAKNASMTYVREDIFRLQLPPQYDIVCSFGVIEHFPDKTEIISTHKKFLSDNGYALIIIPLDSPLTRAFYEVNFELNQGYRELLTSAEFLKILIAENLEVINTARSEGYVYDIVGALCRIPSR